MIALASDHVGIELKRSIIEYLDENGYPYLDYGTYDTVRCNYPEYALKPSSSCIAISPVYNQPSLRTSLVASSFR